MAVQDRLLGPRPEYKLEGTPLAIGIPAPGGTRRSVVALDGATGELIWAHSVREENAPACAEAAADAACRSDRRQGRRRILYVTTGYRLVALNAKNGAVIGFGTAAWST